MQAKLVTIPRKLWDETADLSTLPERYRVWIKEGGRWKAVRADMTEHLDVRECWRTRKGAE
jgi:hypothetical protein